MGLKLEVGKYYRGVDGNKYGPMECLGLSEHPWNEAGSVSYHVWRCDGTSKWQGDPTLIAEWPSDDAPTGPVRTVTRKEIVPGLYLDGTLIVSDAGFGRLQFAICTTDPESFDKAMDMLRDIRDALEDNHADRP